ncbi:MAG: hypothetical protein JSV19_07085 [Phycisphaerales bacterium]|nr:MAG: hypothetical protein JSV19_07085 [Phycisphaerales bacterium]
MKSRFAKLVLTGVIVHLAANAALGLSWGPFSFGFFNSTLNQWFLLPFTLMGCG